MGTEQTKLLKYFTSPGSFILSQVVKSQPKTNVRTTPQAHKEKLNEAKPQTNKMKSKLKASLAEHQAAELKKKVLPFSANSAPLRESWLLP
jgi:hypothetical protein